MIVNKAFVYINRCCTQRIITHLIAMVQQIVRKYLSFDIRPDSFSQESMKRFIEETSVSDGIVLCPKDPEKTTGQDETRKGWYRCYFFREGKKAFSLCRGVETLARKLRIDSSAVKICHGMRPYYYRIYLRFALDATTALEEQTLFAKGMFALDKLKSAIVRGRTEGKGAVHSDKVAVEPKLVMGDILDILPRPDDREMHEDDVDTGEHGKNHLFFRTYIFSLKNHDL